MNIIAQILGGGAVLSSLIIYQQKKRSRLLIFKLIQDVCWCLHYLILNAYSAAATSFICISRSVVYVNNDKKIFSSRLWLLFYVLLYAVSAVITWQGIFSIFPAVSSILSSIGFWLKNVRHTKMISICASLCSLIYNINVSHSVAVYVGVTITVTTSLFSIIRDVRESKAKKE